MNYLNTIFIGDIIGKPGMDLVNMWLPGLIQKYKADFIIANGENVSDGKGCTDKEGRELFAIGVHVITGGNHTWDKHQSQDYLKNEPRSLRPLNYPKGTYGNGYYVAETKKGKVAVVNLQGRSFMATIDCPFRTADYFVPKLKSETKTIFVDFHAEATAEKMALAWHLDGRASAVIGTHTHIPTSDARILPKGTAYITDVGMCGPFDSIIGMEKETVINGFISQLPRKFEVAQGNVVLQGIIVEVDPANGKAREMRRLRLYHESLA